jgi:hypothetical protein
MRSTAPLARPLHPRDHKNRGWNIGGQLMTHTASAPSVNFSDFGARTGVRQLLFKPDHPRAIDQHIDYFGGATEPTSDMEADVCGEMILERPA